MDKEPNELALQMKLVCLACGWHKPWEKSYMHFEYDSELLHKNGVVQKLCTECHHWWWPQEFGSAESDSQKLIRSRKK